MRFWDRDKHIMMKADEENGAKLDEQKSCTDDALAYPELFKVETGDSK